MKGKFIIHPSKDGQFYFTFVARNGEVQCTSEMYPTPVAAVEGASALASNMSLAYAHAAFFRDMVEFA